MDEMETVARAQRGDLRAFNRLVLAYQNLAYNVAYRIMGDADAAADVCQEAFLSAFRHIRALRGSSFKSWLLRIVTNMCYDHLRYQRRRPAHSLEELTTSEDAGENPEHFSWMTHEGAGPEEQIMSRELADVLQSGIASLPADQRAIIVLSDVQGFTYQEIAEITGIPLGTVKSRLSRARAKLRDYLLAAHPELLPDKYRQLIRDEEETT
ncbi:MAG: RNA polymerase subunit sigma-24 [Ardenticatenia bacterium]|jgi:RNA polymerase sigma-70 factor (ECF subfamily)|nr:MAG: RNA polymerase subunit sigma-24 [Ardenticatenia bacterium]